MAVSAQNNNNNNNNKTKQKQKTKQNKAAKFADGLPILHVALQSYFYWTIKQQNISLIFPKQTV